MLENQLSYCFAQDCACEPPCLTVNQKEFFLVNEIKGNCYNLDVTVLHYVMTDLSFAYTEKNTITLS